MAATPLDDLECNLLAMLEATRALRAVMGGGDPAPTPSPEPDLFGGAPFTPEQERRLRVIAWDAASAREISHSLREGGLPLRADEVRRSFIEDGKL
jgi:hypothetical protein